MILLRVTVLVNIFFFFRSLTELVDVSKYGSRIAVMNGNTGQYMVNPTHSVTKVFQDLKKSYGNCE